MHPRNTSANRPKHIDINYRVDILEIEKIKLHEEIDYLQQQIQQLTNEYSDKILEKDQEIINTQMQIQGVDKFNGELLQKLQCTKKNEEQLNNANYNYIQLQKKVNTLQIENQQLTSKVAQLNQQSQQFQQNWQRCSQQLKLNSNQKVKLKEAEQQLEKKIEEFNQIKEKYVQNQLELTIVKQSESEYKHQVENKIKQLFDQLKESQQQQQMMQNIIQNEQCLKCEQYQEELHYLKNIVNQDGIQFEQNRVNQQINYQLQDQMKEYYNKILELELENHNQAKQLEHYKNIKQQENSLYQQVKQNDGQQYNRSIKTQPEYIKLIKLVDSSLKDQVTKEMFKRSLTDLAKEVDQRDSIIQQLQESKTKYDRLLVKYYAMQKRLGLIEQQEAESDVSIPQFTLQKKPQMESFFSQQDTTKQAKTPQQESTPKQVKKVEQQQSSVKRQQQSYSQHQQQQQQQLNLSLDSSGYQYFIRSQNQQKPQQQHQQ